MTGTTAAKGGSDVEIQVHGKHHQVGDHFRETARKKVEHAARFFEIDPLAVDVEVAEERNPRLAGERFRVEITAPVAGHVVRVEAASVDEEAALDLAVEKFEGQLRRVKDRLITRSRTDEHKRLNHQAPEVETEEEASVLRIVRTKQFVMKPMSPEEAALQMDMLGHTFFFFLNSETDHPSVLYRRRNGSLGLIEPA